MAEVDPLSPKHALPSSLRVPIAASGADALERYVGKIQRTIVSRAAARTGTSASAFLVRSHARPDAEQPGVRLWQEPMAARYVARLFPELQVWVHVDYRGYLSAYRKFGLTIPVGYFLDHVQNRKAVRLQIEFQAAAAERGLTSPDEQHSYLRLCPVQAGVNTSGGVDSGGEGMEREFLAERIDRLRRGELPRESVEVLLTGMRGAVVYADPMDLTKMLDILPGTRPLDGVRDTQVLFFPSMP